jgi:hypothetical protein
MSFTRCFAAYAFLILAVSVPDAAVTSINYATGVARRTTSNHPGNYLVPLLEPGIYPVGEFKLQGNKIPAGYGRTSGGIVNV